MHKNSSAGTTGKRNRRLILGVILCIASSLSVFSQSELGETSMPSSSWGMLAYQRTWTPQKNHYPNAGFGFQFFTSLDQEKTYWFGASIIGSGLERRDVMAVALGPGVYFLGSGKLGCFAFLHAGICLTSQSGVTNFNFIGDPTTAIGFSTMSGIGASMDIFKFLRMHLALVGNVYTLDGGHTPYGIQVGITSGGK